MMSPGMDRGSSRAAPRAAALQPGAGPAAPRAASAHGATFSVTTIEIPNYAIGLKIPIQIAVYIVVIIQRKN